MNPFSELQGAKLSQSWQKFCKMGFYGGPGTRYEIKRSLEMLDWRKVNS